MQNIFIYFSLCEKYSDYVLAITAIASIIFGAQFFSTCEAQENVRPYKIDWPAGWEINELPTPTDNRHSCGGTRVRALRKNGNMVGQKANFDKYKSDFD